MRCRGFSARRVLTLVLSFAVLGLPAMAQGTTTTTARIGPAEFGEPFPVATYKNLNAGAGGPATIDLADFVGGKPVVLHYWIAGHSRSEETFQRLQGVIQEVGPDKIALLGVVTERPGREAPQIIERIRALGIRVPVLNDEGFKIGQQLLVRTVPSISILDSQGRLRLAGGASLLQTVEYNLNIEGVIRRAAESGSLGTHGQMPRYYPVTELVGKQCPDFQAPMLTNGVVQRWYSLLDPEQVNVLLFWSVDCPHCKKALPEINEYLRGNPDGINLVSAAKILNNEMKTRTREFCKYNGFVFPTLIDENQALGELFMVTATPTMLIIRPDGVIDSVVVSGTGDFARTIEAKKKELLDSG